MLLHTKEMQLKKDMMLSVSATTALVNIVGILEEQYI